MMLTSRIALLTADMHDNSAKDSLLVKNLVLLLAVLLQVSTVGAQQKTGLYIDSSGKVGIGKADPVSMLDVKGRIKDSTGYVIPTNGAVIMYYGLRSDFQTNGTGKKGSKVEGWALCDGQGGRLRADLLKQIAINNNNQLFVINWNIVFPFKLSWDMTYTGFQDEIPQYGGTTAGTNDKISQRTIFYITKL
jgi:hypothetical protein